ncbi:carboxylic acid transporter, partial [Teratosphaeria nubilosa]
MLSAKSWMYFALACFAWGSDGYDFNTVNLVSTELATRYDTSVSKITLAVTLTLVFRGPGSALIGICADAFGRKWPLAIDLLIICALQIATAYAPTYATFILVRTLFGVFMGGIWGLAAATSLENMPVEARGIMSGFLQQAYSVGYLIAAGINLRTGKDSDTYRLVFYVGAGLTGATALASALIPESHIYTQKSMSATDPENHTPAKRTTKATFSAFYSDTKLVARNHWKPALYCIVLMTFANWMNHAAADTYPNFLKIQKGFSNYDASIIVIIIQFGSITGGPFFGWLSQFIGRRLAIAIACTIALAFLPLWILPNSMGALAAGGFFLQFFTLGSWGVMPIFLQEYSPPQFRGFFPGTVYQVGNMFAAPAAQIMTVGAEHWIVDGKPEFGYTMWIAEVVALVLMLVWIACGEEKVGSRFELV